VDACMCIKAKSDWCQIERLTGIYNNPLRYWI